MQLSSTEEIIAELRAGRMTILVDEEDRENEGDILIAADAITPEAINFMAKHARGLICLTLTPERCAELGLSLMAQHNGTAYGTAFTVSIEAAVGVTTGISAADRACTVLAAVRPGARAKDLVQPGHIFPLMAQAGGVLVRAGHTEAGCDLAQLAGRAPAAVICEVMSDDGTMARLPELLEFGQRHGIKIGSIADLIDYRLRNESVIERLCERPMHTPYGEFRAVMYRDRPAQALHLALVHGAPQPQEETLVRVHEPLTAFDLLDLDDPTHSWTLPAALREIASHGAGVAVLLNCEGGGVLEGGLLERFRLASAPQDGASPARERNHFKTYGIGAQILRDLGVKRMRVLAAPRKLTIMSGYGLEVTDCVPMPPQARHSAESPVSGRPKAL